MKVNLGMKGLMSLGMDFPKINRSVKVISDTSMAYHGRYQKLLWSLLRAMDFSGQKQIGSHYVIDTHSGIKFAFAQKSALL